MTNDCVYCQCIFIYSMSKLCDFIIEMLYLHVLCYVQHLFPFKVQCYLCTNLLTLNDRIDHGHDEYYPECSSLFLDLSEENVRNDYFDLGNKKSGTTATFSLILGSNT